MKVSVAAEGGEDGSGKEVAGSGLLSDHSGSEVGVVEAEKTASWILRDNSDYFLVILMKRWEMR